MAQSSSVRYSLRTFGGLALIDTATGQAVAEKHRKALALLAVLAASGDLPITRDKAAAYFWTDGEPERVRSVLKQTIYTLRRDLGETDAIVGQLDIHLNGELVSTDLAAFEAAVQAADAATAALLYRGPFLDGFHLPDAPGFERWVDGQRDRLAREFAGLMAQTALAAMARHDPRGAMDWWSRLLEVDPYDSRAVSGLLHACLAAGERARAIRLAERHMGLLRKELEITPDPEIRRLVDLARARPAPGGAS